MTRRVAGGMLHGRKMRVDVRCVDWMTERPVPGVDLTFVVRLAPRVRPPEPDLPGPQPLVVLESEAVDFPASRIRSDAAGNGSFTVDVSPAYERMLSANQGRAGFEDVATFVRTRGRLDGLDRDSGMVLVTTDGDVDVERLIIIDLAKTIVGHTTASTACLWFQLHGRTVSGHRYECEVTPSTAAPGELPLLEEVTFEPDRAMSGTVDLKRLTAGRAYEYRLWLRRPAGDERPDRELCAGSFTTDDPDAASTTIMFGSCFHPLEEGRPRDDQRNLRHWRRLADNAEGDVQLFLGDQIYGDEVFRQRGESWYDAYVRRYNAFWAYQPVRRALARRSTYMITDDHEVKDDWGTASIEEERVTGAVDALRTYQIAHAPPGTAAISTTISAAVRWPSS